MLRIIRDVSRGKILLILLLTILSSVLPGWTGTRVPPNGQLNSINGTASDTSNAVQLLIAGDCTFAGHFEAFVGDRFEYPFERLGWFRTADLSMVNLENPITVRGERVSKRFNFRMHPKYLKVLLDGGIDVVNLANNHTLDYGAQGLLDTIHFLDSVGVKHVGAGRDLHSAREPRVFEIRGTRVGFLAYFGVGGFSATPTTAGVVPRTEGLVEEDIQNLRANYQTDYIVVSFHWGKEKAVYPEGWQIGLAHFAVDAGADLVIGHHPHVLQGIEKYKNGVIAYSLGNFIFGGNSLNTYDTAVLQVEIQKGGAQVSVIPIRVEEWQPYRLEGAEAQAALSSLRRLSRIFRETIFQAGTVEQRRK